MSDNFKNRARLGVEDLESRELMSWGAVPPSVMPTTGGDRFTITRTSNDGVYRDTDQVNRSETDYYKFVAQRTGTYTFQAKKASSSQIDTVVALYNGYGNRIAYNDDANANTTNSKMTANLTAGRTYTFAVTKYNGSANGIYNLTFTPPSIGNSAEVGGGDFYSYGSATLSGTNLQLYLYGYTNDAFSYADHQIEVQILDRSGNPIHTGSWIRGFRTAGDFVPGSPTSDFDTWNFDLSGFDMSRASRIWVRVSYS